MPQKIVISDVTITDTSIPKLRDDPLLADGSLFLFDPGHTFGSIGAGVPGGGTPLPNVAWKEAAAVLGAGTQASLAGTVVRVDADAAGLWKIERTTKGGIHGISTQAGGQTIGRNWYAKTPQAVADFLRANAATRAFYFSVWRKITRPLSAAANPAPQSPFHLANDTSNALFYMSGGSFTPSASGNPTAFNGASRFPDLHDGQQAAGTDVFLAGSTVNKIGNVNAGTTCDFGVGTFDAWDSYNWNKAASYVLYRVYIEDLSASGRTFAQVQALDLALFQAAFGAGGRFSGDTYTNPSTLP